MGADLGASSPQIESALTPEFCAQLAHECYVDPVLYCKTFLEAWFPRQIPWVHRGILALLLGRADFLLKYGEMDKILSHFVYRENPNDDTAPWLPMFKVIEVDGVTRVWIADKDQILIMMPRGFSKTTLANAATHMKITYHDCNFPVYISETATHAEMQLRNIRMEFEANELHRAVFGNKVPSRNSSLKWTDEQITTVDDVNVQAKGRGMQIRGMNYKSFRPDCFVIDDVEDKESVSTPEQILKTRSWFFADVLPAIDRMKSKSKILFLGTLLHRDALMMHLMLDPTWTIIRFSAIDNDGEALWADNMSLEKLEKLKQSYAHAGKLSEFYMEFMSQLRDEQTALFRREYIRYEKLDPSLIAATAIATDPAISKNVKADEATFGVVSMLTNGKLVVRAVTGRVGMTPREQLDEYFRLCKLFLPDKHGVEAQAFQAALVHLLQEEMFRENYYFEVIPITHSTQKEARIRGVLQPRYASGYVLHERIFPEYEKELLDFPQGKDNFVDVVAMAITLLDPYAAQAADPTKDLGEDTMPPIDEEIGDEYFAAP